MMMHGLTNFKFISEPNVCLDNIKVRLWRNVIGKQQRALLYASRASLHHTPTFILQSHSLSGVYSNSGQQRYILPPTPEIVTLQTFQEGNNE
jgi:hypothetical protein